MPCALHSLAGRVLARQRTGPPDPADETAAVAGTHGGGRNLKASREAFEGKKNNSSSAVGIALLLVFIFASLEASVWLQHSDELPAATGAYSSACNEPGACAVAWLEGAR